MTYAVLSLRVLHPGSPTSTSPSRLWTRLRIKGGPPCRSAKELYRDLMTPGLSKLFGCSGELMGKAIVLADPFDTGIVIGKSTGVLDRCAMGVCSRPNWSETEDDSFSSSVSARRNGIWPGRWSVRSGVTDLEPIPLSSEPA